MNWSRLSSAECLPRPCIVARVVAAENGIIIICTESESQELNTPFYPTHRSQ
jgi:hypothetical protein